MFYHSSSYHLGHNPDSMSSTCMSEIRNQFDRALTCYKAGQTAEAQQLCRTILSESPGFSGALHLLGMIEHAEGRLDSALQLVLAAVHNHPNQPRLYYDLARVYEDKQLFSQAAACYRKALNLKSDFAEAHFKLGVIEDRSGRVEKAAICYKKALDIDPELAEGWYNLGRIVQSKQQYEEAVYSFHKAVAIYPDFAEAYLHLGDVFRAQNEPAKAIDCFGKFLEFKPESAAGHTKLADALKDCGMLEKAMRHYREVLRLQPESAQVHFKIGSILKSRKDYRQAEKLYLRAIELQPDCPEALFDLGYVREKLGELQAAADCYERVLAIEPDSPETLYNLANVFNQLGRADSAISFVRKAIEFQPELATGYNNLGLYLRAKGRNNEAIANFRKAIRIDPDMAAAHLNLALILLLMGQFGEGWKEYEWRMQVDLYKSDYRYPKQRPWDEKAPGDKGILIYDEQGLGDTLQFVRYLPLFKKLGGTVVFETRKELIRLLEKFPGADRVIERPPETENDNEYDDYIPLLSVPGRMGTDIDTIPMGVPYIFAEPDHVDKWKTCMDRAGFKIGIVWAGNKAHVNDRNRSCSLDQFDWLADFPQTVCFSLQKEVAPEEELQLKGMGVTNLGPLLHDFSDTAAVIENLDLIITVDTAAAHLAGAMGKTTWILLPSDPDWRWMTERSDSPWYPTVRLFRQSRPGDWTTVVASVCRELKKIVNF